MRRSGIIGYLLAAVSVIAFAATFVVGSELTKECEISPAVLSFLRFAIAGTAMFAWEMRSHESRRSLFCLPTRNDWLLFALLGPVGTSIMAWCVFMGCARVSTANASMADALAPLLIFILSAIHMRRATWLQTLGVLFGFAGAMLVIGIITANGIALESYSSGDVYIFFAAATWAFYSVYGRENIKRLGEGAYTTWTMLIGAIFIGAIILIHALIAEYVNVLPDSLIESSVGHSGYSELIVSSASYVWPTTVRAWGLVGVLGIMCTLTPFWAWNAAQKYLPVSTLGMSAYFTPVVAVILAAIFLGEHATFLQWLGTAFICVSSLVECKSYRCSA